MRTFEFETKAGGFVRWACNCCGEKGPVWHRDTARGQARVIKGMAAHQCRVQGPAQAPAKRTEDLTVDELFDRIAQSE